MKEQDVKLTLQETEQLCRLYMDCRLSVLEETELHYVLGKLPYSSPCIDEVRMLMGLTISSRALRNNKKKKHFGFLRSWQIISIAASFTILFVCGLALLHDRTTKLPYDSSLSNDNIPVYVTAYCKGKPLNGNEAITTTKIAMAKADSLMRVASLTESHYMMKANDIITVISNN